MYAVRPELNNMAGFTSKKPGAGFSIDCTEERICCACDVTLKKNSRAGSRGSTMIL
jgi:hypothetical protein